MKVIGWEFNGKMIKNSKNVRSVGVFSVVYRAKSSINGVRNG